MGACIDVVAGQIEIRVGRQKTGDIVHEVEAGRDIEALQIGLRVVDDEDNKAQK
jgi:hypothetical protein